MTLNFEYVNIKNVKKILVSGPKNVYLKDMNLMGGRWNSQIKGKNPGWIMPIEKEALLKQFIESEEKASMDNESDVSSVLSDVSELSDMESFYKDIRAQPPPKNKQVAAVQKDNPVDVQKKKKNKPTVQKNKPVDAQKKNNPDVQKNDQSVSKPLHHIEKQVVVDDGHVVYPHDDVKNEIEDADSIPYESDGESKHTQRQSKDGENENENESSDGEDDISTSSSESEINEVEDADKVEDSEDSDEANEVDDKNKIPSASHDQNKTFPASLVVSVPDEKNTHDADSVCPSNDNDQNESDNCKSPHSQILSIPSPVNRISPCTPQTRMEFLPPDLSTSSYRHAPSPRSQISDCDGNVNVNLSKSVINHKSKSNSEASHLSSEFKTVATENSCSTEENDIYTTDFVRRNTLYILERQYEDKFQSILRGKISLESEIEMLRSKVTALNRDLTSEKRLVSDIQKNFRVKDFKKIEYILNKREIEDIRVELIKRNRYPSELGDFFRKSDDTPILSRESSVGEDERGGASDSHYPSP